MTANKISFYSSSLSSVVYDNSWSFPVLRSEDDPFLLYATLHSGSHCRFVTRDLLRDHKACLPDSLTRRLFFKWQRGHQMVLSDYVSGKRIKFEVSVHCINQFNNNVV